MRASRIWVPVLEFVTSSTDTVLAEALELFKILSLLTALYPFFVFLDN